MTIGSVSFFIAAAFFLTPAPALAYIDPATGSMAFQIVAGTILATLAAGKIYWRKLTSLFRSRQKPEGVNRIS